MLMIILSQLPLALIPLFRYREQASSHCTAGGNHIVPIQIRQRKLREQIEVSLKVPERSNHSRRAIWPTLFITQWHDILGLLLVRLLGEIPRTDLELLLMTREDGHHIDLAILHGFVVRLLGVDLAELALELFVGGDELGDGSGGVLREVGDEVGDGARGELGNHNWLSGFGEGDHDGGFGV